MKRSILHVAQPTDGGVARCVADFAAHQIAMGWEVTVACPSAGQLYDWIQRAGAAHIPWEATREPGLGSLREAARISAAIRSVGPDVLHLHSSKAGLAGRVAVRGRQLTVFQPHCWSFEAVGGGLRRAAISWERLAARWADVIVCVSEAERATGARLRIRARYRVIPNGVDTSQWSVASPEEKASARKSLGVADAPLIVCVGRLCRQKGQDVLLDAWPAVLASFPEAQLVLVGDGPDEPSLRRRAVSRTQLVGSRNDVADWLAAADVVAIPSRWDGMALTVLEAMARGRSLVATDVSGARECLGEEAGGIVPSNDPPALARALIERLRNPKMADAEGGEGRRRVEDAFDIRRTGKAINDVYKDLLLRARPPKGSLPVGRS